MTTKAKASKKSAGTTAKIKAEKHPVNPKTGFRVGFIANEAGEAYLAAGDSKERAIELITRVFSTRWDKQNHKYNPKAPRIQGVLWYRLLNQRDPKRYPVLKDDAVKSPAKKVAAKALAKKASAKKAAAKTPAKKAAAKTPAKKVVVKTSAPVDTPEQVPAA